MEKKQTLKCYYGVNSLGDGKVGWGAGKGLGGGRLSAHITYSLRFFHQIPIKKVDGFTEKKKKKTEVHLRIDKYHA